MVFHYSDVIMGTIASQITSLTIVYSTAYSGANQRKHQISASLAFVRGIHWSPVNSPNNWPVTWKMFPFDDVIMTFVINGTSNNPVKTDGIFHESTSICPKFRIIGRFRWISYPVNFWVRVRWFEKVWKPNMNSSGFSCCNNTVKNIQGYYCVNISVRSSDYPLRPQKYPLRSTHSLGW